MVNNAGEEYITYERFYTLNKHSTSESCIVAASGSIEFYDLDGVAKRNSYSCCTEDVALSTLNIFRALNTKGNEWPRASSPEGPVQIVQECTTSIKPNFGRCVQLQENKNKTKNAFVRECVLSEICLKDPIEGSESSGPNNFRNIDIEIAQIHKCMTDQVKFEDIENSKKDLEILNKDPRQFELDGLSCSYKEEGSVAKTSKSITKQTTLSYREEVINMCNKHKTFLEMEDKLTRMSGDGLTEKYTVKIPRNDTSCILILDGYDLPKISHSQISSPRKSGARLVRVVRNKMRMKPKKVRAVKCPNCYEHLELSVTTEDETSTEVPPKTYGKSEMAFNCPGLSKERIHPKIVTSKECPHGCEMVPLCQILPKVNFNNSGTKQNGHKKPRFIKMTKACRHYPPCTVVPSCQRGNVLKANCESIPPCCHRPRCVNLPLCIPYCKNLQYDEMTKHYVDSEDKEQNCKHELKCVPVSQYKVQIPHAFEPRAYYVNQTHLSCQVPPLNTKQCDIATKSCQYDYPNPEPNNEVKEEAKEASVIYIRDVGCQFKNSSFTPHTSYFQTRVCYTSSASFDPGSKRLDNIYTNPKAFTCETVIIEGKSKLECKAQSMSRSIISSAIESLSSEHESSHKQSSKVQLDNNVAFCMFRNEGGYLVPIKPKRSSVKGKCKNKFTINRRQISKVLSNFWFKKKV